MRVGQDLDFDVARAVHESLDVDRRVAECPERLVLCSLEGVRQVRCTALPGGDDVSPAGIARIALRDTVQTALETEYLGGTGWPGLLDKHSGHDPLAVDALIYLLAVALQSPKPTATVALARGLSPASGPKRVLAARQVGLLPDTAPGKPAGA